MQRCYGIQLNSWRRNLLAVFVPWMLTHGFFAQAQTPPIGVPPAARIDTDSFEVRVYPPVTAALDTKINAALKAVVEQSLEALPATIEDLRVWEEVLTQGLRRGGFPIGLVVMTEEAWATARRTGHFAFTAYAGNIDALALENRSRVTDERLRRVIRQALCGTQDWERAPCILQTESLERTTQLLQDIPGVMLDGAPRAATGDQTGTAGLTFSIAQKGEPYTLGASVDNQGIESTGAARMGVSVSGNNAFGIGDSYAADIFVTNKRMLTGDASASVPLGDSGLRATAGWTTQSYSINAGTALSGLSNTGSVGIDYPFTRGLDRNVRGQILMLHTESKTRYDDFDWSNGSALSSIRVQMQADNGDRQIALRARPWSVTAALTAGHQSSDAPALDMGPQRAGNYVKFLATGFRMWQLGVDGDAFVTGRLVAQLASRNLDFSEKLALGGLNAVRAYSSDETSADDGAIANVGLYRRFPVIPGHQLQVGAFVDIAAARVNHRPWTGWDTAYVGISGVKNERFMAGYGASLDWLTPFGLTVSLAVARRFPFASAPWSQSGGRRNQFWLNASLSH